MKVVYAHKGRRMDNGFKLWPRDADALLASDKFGSDNDKITRYWISDVEDAWTKAAFKMRLDQG